MPSQPLGEHGDRVVDEVPGHRGAACLADDGVLAAGAYGTGTEMTTAIDGRGLEKAAAAALTSGVRRFVLVSVSWTPCATSRAPKGSSTT
jgi:hypothetical protein